MTKAPRRKISPLSSTPFTKNEDAEIWKFLWGKIQSKRNGGTRKLDILNRRLWNDFKCPGVVKRSHQEYQNRFIAALAPSLHKTSFGFQKKIDLYHGLGIPVEEDFKNALICSGRLKLDGVGCIVSFNAFEKEEPGRKKFQKEVEPETSALRSGHPEVRPIEKNSHSSETSPTKAFSADEEKNMWMSLLFKIRDEMTGEPVKRSVSADLNFWKSYKPPSADGRTAQEYFIQYSKVMCHTLHEAKMPKQFKLDLYYALGLKVNKAFLFELKQSADVDIDKQGRIEKYKDRHEGGIVLGYQENIEAARKVNVSTPKDDLDTDSSEYDPERAQANYECDSNTDLSPSDDDSMEEQDTVDFPESWWEPDCHQEEQKKAPQPYQKIRQMKRRIISHYNEETFHCADQYLRNLRQTLACLESADFNDLKCEVDAMLASGNCVGKRIPSSGVDHLAAYAVKLVEDISP